jgi:hypothetical protein
MADGCTSLGAASLYWYMINSRDKGKRFELKMAKVWMRLFGGNVERTSYASKKLDDMGVDLTDTDPFNIQCKAVESSMNYHQILERMPQSTNINLVVHKRNHQPPVAALYLEDFLELLTAMKREGIL